jgi:hypothetical protein
VDTGQVNELSWRVALSNNIHRRGNVPIRCQRSHLPHQPLLSRDGSTGQIVQDLVTGVVTGREGDAGSAAHLRAVQSSFAAVLTDFVRQRYPQVPDLDLVAEVTGSVLAAALVAAVEHWGRQGCVGDLGAVVAAGLELIRSGLAPLSDPA